MYLGIDISKERLDCCQLSEGSAEARAFSNTEGGVAELVAWLAEDAEAHIVMEATGVYWQRSALVLYEAGYKVSVVNPAGVKYFAQSLLRRGKTDRMDAELLAHYAAKMQPSAWRPTPPLYEELKVLVRERDSIVAQLRQLNNQRHAHQHRTNCPEMIFSLLEQRIELLTKQRKRLEGEIERLCQGSCQEAYECLRSIPGVGPVTASTLLAETAGMESFVHPKQVTAYAGIAPAPHQSGTFAGRATISKVGNPRIRKALYMAALQARRHSVFAHLYQRLIQKGKAPKLALIAVARKLLVIAFTLVKSKQLFDPHRLAESKA